MGRLIDEDLLKKSIAKWLQGSDPQETQMVKLDDIAVSVIMEIDEQPTAYNVDAVVAEIRRSSGNGYRDIDGDYVPPMIETKDAIDIVRKGGAK